MVTSTGRDGIIRIYCDFDGTIVREDVGDMFFEHFSGAEMWDDNKQYRDGAMTAEELYRRNLLRIERLTPDDIAAFCKGFEIDHSFPPFVDWAEERSYPLLIVSDGLDVYIRLLLEKAGLARVPFTANTLTLSEDGTPDILFPHSYPDCTCSANCKRNQLLLNSADEDYIVYIGDGISDFCPARYADLVFARDALETFCQQENISFRRFDSFHDVRSVLEVLSAKKTLRKPKRAELLRKAVWMGG